MHENVEIVAGAEAIFAKIAGLNDEKKMEKRVCRSQTL